MADIAWRPKIGDPTLIGWITVVAYLISFLFCVRAGLRTRRLTQETQGESPILWFIFAAGLFLLGLNKQLDLQTALIQVARQTALGEGWYQQRRLAQIIFVLMLGIAISGAFFIIVYQQHRFFKNHALALLGSIFLAAFVFLRAVIFNHADADAGFGLGEGDWLCSLELTGVFCFIIASIRAAKNSPPISTRNK